MEEKMGIIGRSMGGLLLLWAAVSFWDDDQTFSIWILVIALFMIGSAIFSIICSIRNSFGSIYAKDGEIDDWRDGLKGCSWVFFSFAGFTLATLFFSKGFYGLSRFLPHEWFVSQESDKFMLDLYLGIFTVIGLIIIVVVLRNKFNKLKEENADLKEELEDTTKKRKSAKFATKD